jgi:uncharacterized protein
MASIGTTSGGMKITSFLAFAFVWSWTNWIIGLGYLHDGINSESLDRFVTYFFIGVYGPAIAAILAALCFDGLTGLIQLMKKLVSWKAPLSSYLFIIFFPLIFMASGIALYAFFFGEVGDVNFAETRAIPKLLFASLLAGPLGEELGWRGWLLPQVQKHFNAMTSSIIIAPVWFVWHLPLFFAPFGTLISGAEFSLVTSVTYLLFVICLSCLYTWLVNNSRGSVLIAILIHLSINAGLLLLFFPALKEEAKLIYLLFTPIIVLITIYIGVKSRFESQANKANNITS